MCEKIMQGKMKKEQFKKIYLIRMGSSVVRESGGQPRHFSPSYTLKYIQSLLLENKNQVKLLDCLVDPKLLQLILSDILDWSASLIVVESTMYGQKAAFQLAQLIKKNSDIVTVATGQGPTSDGTEYCVADSFFDVVFSGEAEQEVLHLIKRLNDGENMPELMESYRNNRRKNKITIIHELDSLPFPQYNWTELKCYQFLYPIRSNKKLIWGHILSSRGCLSPCTFCSQITRETYGKKVRLRSAVNVVDEIEYLISLGVNIVSFDDDNFAFSNEHATSISEEIIKRKLNIKWIAHARIDELTFSVLDIMKKAGCTLLRFGVESGSKRILKILDKSAVDSDWIGIGKSIFRYSRRIGIATNALLMIGNPTETENEIKDTLKFVKLLKPDLIQLHFFTPYPGSVVYEQYKTQINKEDLFESYHYCAPKVNLSNVSSGRLLICRSRFYRSFYLRPFFLIEHFFRYVLFYMCNINVTCKLTSFYKIFFKNENIIS